MKLPGIQYSQGVKPLAVQPSGAEATLARAKADAETARTFSNLALTVSEGIANEQGKQRAADASLAMKKIYAKAMTSPNALDAPGELDEGIESIRDTASREMDPISYKAFASKFDQEANNLQGRIIVDSTYRANKEQRTSTSAKALELSRDGEVDQAVTLVGESMLFSEPEKQKIYDEMNHQFALGAVEQATYSNDPDRIAGEIRNLKSDKYSGPLEGSERSAAIGSLEGAFKDATAAVQEEIAHRRGRILGDMSIAIRTGKAGPLQIEEVYNKYPEFVTPAKREEMMELYLKISTERNTAMNRKIDVRQALALGEPLSPKEPDHVKGVDEVFKDDPTLSNGVGLAIKTNIMPSTLKMDFIRMPIAGKPERVLELANAFEVIQRENPIAVEGIGAKQIAIYTSVASMARGGMPLEEAVDIARKNAAVPPEERQQFRFDLKSQEDSSTDRLNRYMDRSDVMDISYGWFGAPEASPAMRAAYASIEAEYFTLMGGDIDLAGEAAFKHMRRIYSGTEINGKDEVMAYAPDRMTGMPTEVLRKQLITSTKKIEGMDKVLPKHIFIVSDAQTARESGVKSYPVFKLNRYELPEPVMDEDGMQHRWTPDHTKYTKKLKIQRGKELTKEKVGIMTSGKEQQFLFGR